MIRPNAVITALALPTGHDGESPTYTDQDMARDALCEVLTIGEARRDGLASRGIEATRALEMLGGELRAITDEPVLGATLTIKLQIRGGERTERLVVTGTREDAVPASALDVVELLCKPSRDSAPVEEAVS